MSLDYPCQSLWTMPLQSIDEPTPPFGWMQLQRKQRMSIYCILHSRGWQGCSTLFPFCTMLWAMFLQHLHGSCHYTQNCLYCPNACSPKLTACDVYRHHECLNHCSMQRKIWTMLRSEFEKDKHMKSITARALQRLKPTGLAFREHLKGPMSSLDNKNHS